MLYALNVSGRGDVALWASVSGNGNGKLPIRSKSSLKS
jgi:hypothetical protein